MALSLRHHPKNIMKNDQKNQSFGSQEGSGSSENQGRDREEQRHNLTDMDKQGKKDIAHEAGLGRKRMADIEDLGGLSGRDDYAGGSGDDMSNTSTNEATDR